MCEPRALVEHFFRHEFGRVGALLTRSLGVRRLDLVEDVVQAALVQALAGQWYGWMQKFSASILPGGDGLKPSGRLLRGQIVTDGPYVEAKEFVASFTLIQAENYDAALAIAKECPGDNVIEIRQLGGYA